MRDTIGLPDGEAIDVEVVRDKPWRGFARYQSNFRTHISVNVDLPFEAGILSHFVAHECYPGHHAAAVQRARHDLGWVPGNMTILLRGRGASHAEAVDYVRRWGLQPDGRIERMVTITETEDSPGYVHTYSQGSELCRAWTGLDPQRLRELMTGRLVPADLA